MTDFCTSQASARARTADFSADLIPTAHFSVLPAMHTHVLRAGAVLTAGRTAGTILLAAVLSWLAFASPPPHEDSEVGSIATKVGLSPGMVFADVGSNDGSFAEEYLRIVRPGGGHGFATDVASNLGFLRSRAASLGEGALTIRAIEDPNRGLPADGSLDAITMRMSFHYEHEPMAAAASYFRALRPGGKLMIMEHPGCSWASMDNGSPSLAVIGQRNPFGEMSPLGNGHSLAWPPVQLIFKAAGFEVVEHGDWGGGMWMPCSWYAVFRKPVG
jgi:SAM-dependent methyltransferase